MGFSCFCNEVEEKLGRKLEDDEICFLRWMYERHLEEKKSD